MMLYRHKDSRTSDEFFKTHTDLPRNSHDPLLACCDVFLFPGKLTSSFSSATAPLAVSHLFPDLGLLSL